MVDRSTAAVRLMAGDKEPVRLASTANLALAGLLTVDGVVTVAGDRVLVKDQTDATANGIYTASEGTWRRAPDSASNRTLIAGMKVAVQEGTQGGDVWNLLTNRPDLGADDIEFEFYLNTAIVADINAAQQALVDEAAAIIAMGLGAGKASQAEAEAGVTNVPWMTPLRTAQAIGKSVPARTFKANATAGAAAPTDIDITALTEKTSLESNDVFLVLDSAASFAFKKIKGSATGGAVAGALYGLTIANNASDATNDIDISAGKATDSTNAVSIALAAGITKRLDASWAVGSGNGGLDTGSIANGTYHIFIIQRPDTGVVDALFSLSPSAPTMPTNYTYKRRIASIIRASGTILAFRQFGDLFKLSVPVLDRSSTFAVTDALITLTVPSGIKVNPIVVADISQTTAGSSGQLFDDADILTATVAIARSGLAGETGLGQTQACVTNTASQLRYTFFTSGTISGARVTTLGWADGRGR